MGNRRSAGHLAALFTIIIWGTTFISTKVLLVDFRPVEILFFRFVMVFVALLLACPHRMKGVGGRQPETEYTVAGLSEKEMITEEDGGIMAYPLFPFDPSRNLEVFYIEFDAEVTNYSLPHVAGVEEYILPVQGNLKMVIGGNEVFLQERQSIRFGADISHKYHNVSDEVCNVYNVIFYPDN
jgi:mannose-6-phosphate isomerase-like protein (cupin superfamily)